MAKCAWMLTPLAFFLTFQTQGNALKLTKLGVPAYKVKGDMAILECHYELGKEVLYSVKWYKDNEEFYRFVPKSDPPQSSYSVDGIRVDHKLSDSKQVALRQVNLKSSGLYKCEVSAEAPSFSSVQKESRMEVVFLPSKGPHITGGEDQYQVGDKINLNCTSGRSFPASMLHWYINDIQVRDSHALIHYPEEVHSPHGLLSSTLGLNLVISGSHFADGQMRVRCVASVSPVLWKGDKESVVQRVAPLLDNREALILLKGTTNCSGRFAGPALIVVLLTLVIQLTNS